MRILISKLATYWGKSHTEDLSVLDAYNTGIDFLAEGKINEANAILSRYFPTLGCRALDYALYTFEFARGFGELLTSPAPWYYQAVEELFDKIKTRSRICYNQIISSDENLSHTKEQIENTRRLLIEPDISDHATKRINSSPAPDILINAYKNRFEITYFLNLIANLVKCSKGELYLPEPFKKLAHKGKKIYKGGQIQKGLAVQWLLDNTTGNIRKAIAWAYNPNLRNLSGHNEYSYSDKVQEYRRLDGKLAIKYKGVLAFHNNLRNFQHYLFLRRAIRYYEDSVEFVESFGNMDVKSSIVNGTVKRIGLFQWWANFRLRVERGIPDTLSFSTTPMEGKENVVSVFLGNNRMIPYDLRVIAGKKFLKLLEILGREKYVELEILAVAPPITEFKDLCGMVSLINRQKMFIIGSERKRVAIDHASLIHLIDNLKKVL